MATLLDNWANNAVGTVSGGQFSNTTNPLTFTVGPTDLVDDGGNAISAPFTLTVWDSTQGANPRADSQMEIVYVTARAGTSCTANRGQENTSVVNHSASTLTCMAGLTAGAVNMLADAMTWTACRTVSTNTAAVQTDKIIVVTTPVTVTLMSAPGTGAEITVKAMVDGVVVAGNIEGTAGQTMVLFSGFSADLFFDGSTWRLM